MPRTRSHREHTPSPPPQRLKSATQTTTKKQQPPKVLDLFPEATVVGSKVCLNFLKGLTLRDFASRAVKGGDKLDLGGGHELEFVMAPNLHW